MGSKVFSRESGFDLCGQLHHVGGGSIAIRLRPSCFGVDLSIYRFLRVPFLGFRRETKGKYTCLVSSFGSLLFAAFARGDEGSGGLGLGSGRFEELNTTRPGWSTSPRREASSFMAGL